MIDKIGGLGGMRNLRILSLSRNNIKSLAGIEPVADILEELWISYNTISSLKGIEQMKKLKVLYIANNSIREWSEFNKLQAVPTLEDLLFAGNPLVENLEEPVSFKEVSRRLAFLKKLDGEPIVRDEED